MSNNKLRDSNSLDTREPHEPRGEQPVLEGDKEAWIYTYEPHTKGKYHIRVYGNDDCIAHCETRQNAERVITDHARAALVPVLLNVLHDAMKVVADKAAGGRMLTTQNEARDVWQRYADVLAAASCEG